MKKKAKPTNNKPKKASAKKPAAKKPAAKKPVAKKPAKKVTAKKVSAKVKPAKKQVKKVAVKAKPVKPAKVVAKKPEPKIKSVAKKPEPKVVAKKIEVKPVVKVDPKAGPRPAPTAKAVRKPPAPRKRFVVLPPRPLVPSEVKDDVKNAKGLYKLEYIVSSSPDVLFEFLSTAGGLEKWFAPRVFIKDNNFIFSWGNDEMKQATLLALREREFVRFRWQEQTDKRYFEFRLQIDDLTNEIALIVSDFADSKDELDSARLLWNAQIHDLLHALGSS